MNDYRYRFNRFVDRGIDYAIGNPRVAFKAANMASKVVINSGLKAAYDAGRAVGHRIDKVISFSKSDMPVTPKQRKNSLPTPPRSGKRRYSTSSSISGVTPMVIDSQQFKRQIVKGRKRKSFSTTGNAIPSYGRKFKKTVKIKRKASINKSLYGCLLQNEQNDVITSNTNAWITQAAPIILLKKSIWYSFVRHIFNKLDVNVTSYVDAIPITCLGDGSVAQVCDFNFIYWTVSSSAASNVAVPFTTGTTSFNSLGDLMLAAMDNLHYLNAEGLQFQDVQVRWTSGGTRFATKSFDCSHCMFSGYWKNDMSIQNTTLTSDATGTTATDSVTANPVEVVMYKGKGTGPLAEIARRGNYAGLLSDDNLGYRIYAPSTSSAIGNEPLPTAAFGNCRRTGKDVIQPGSIKKSKMQQTINSNLWKLYSVLSGKTISSLAYKRIGMYTTFSFDKMVTKAVDNVVSISFEVNQEAGGRIKNSFRAKVVPFVTSA